MSEQTLWGALIIIYVIPFWIWQISEYGTIETRKKLYSERPDEQLHESRLINRSIAWCVGLVILIVGWMADWHPMGAGIVLVGAALSLFIIYFSLRRWQVMAKRTFRFWLAGTFVWALAVGAWYLVFSRVSDLRGEEVFFLAFLPPLIVAIGIVAWHWAKAPKLYE